MKCGESDKRNKEFEITFDEKLYFKSLISTVDPVIFDIGSHQGESIDFFQGMFPSATIHAFEPNPENSSKIRIREGVTINTIALSNFVGRSKFYIQSLSHMGSLLKINNKSLDSLNYAATASNQESEVDVDTGDNYVVRHDIKNINLLKIDVQGSEVEVLSGFRKSLNMIDSICVEISLYDFYSQNSSFYDIESVIREHFLLWDILKLSKNPKNLRTDWIEAVYINKRVR